MRTGGGWEGSVRPALAGARARGAAGANLQTGINHLGRLSYYSPITDDLAGHYSAAPEYYGLLAFAQFLPALPLALFAGVIADRNDRCHMLIWTQSLLQDGLANLHDTLSLYAMGLMATALSCYVVVPYGYVCQRVMHRLSGIDESSTAR